MQQSIKEQWRSINLLEISAELSVDRHDLLGAARLYGAAERLRAFLKIPRMPINHPRYKESLKKLRDQLAPPALDEAWNAGQALTLEQAVIYALRCLE